jgi:WD40 repeat protein
LLWEISILLYVLSRQNKSLEMALKQSQVAVADSQGSQSDQATMDLTTNIIDKVAWESNFSVKIPLNRRRYSAAHKGHATCVKYDRTGSSLVTGGEDACIRVWDARLGNQVRSKSN